MSRIGKLPITVPEKVTVSVADGLVKVDGPKGKLERRFDPSTVEIKVEDGTVNVSPANETRFAKAMHGTARATVAHMVQGVVTPYAKSLTINGVGFKATLKGKALLLNLGYSHDILEPIPAGVVVEVPEPTKVKVSGPDKQAVGQFTARVKHHYPIEPYKGKGVTIDGEYVRRKEGKKAG